MKANLFSLLLLVGFSIPGVAQEVSAEQRRRVDTIFSRWDDFDKPGMAVGVIRNGSLILADGYGQANLETGLGNGPDVIYRIGSTSKQFTAACVALLALDGKLELGADIRTFFPEFPARDPAITVRHLIHHTSGLPDYIDLQFKAAGSGKAWFKPKDSLAAIAGAASEFAPGERFSYSNSNYLLLGEIVRNASSLSLRDFARARIFEPLGMESTHFHDRHDEVVVGRSHGYSPQPEKGRGDWRVDITTLDHVGDGGVFTTIEDLARWDANFKDNTLGHGPALLELMHTRGRLRDGSELDYAFGLIHGTLRGLKTVHHGGSWVGYRAQLLRIPGAALTVIVLSNQTTGNVTALAQAVTDVFLDA